MVKAAIKFVKCHDPMFYSYFSQFYATLRNSVAIGLLTSAVVAGEAADRGAGTEHQDNVLDEWSQLLIMISGQNAPGLFPKAIVDMYDYNKA
ncbi:hypothetical protein BG000_002368 [Podila horticola]|nr:hypothetical protein BG000_002368 [Podila horticola]